MCCIRNTKKQCVERFASERFREVQDLGNFVTNSLRDGLTLTLVYRAFGITIRCGHLRSSALKINHTHK